MLHYQEIISKMTLEQKASMMSGQDTWRTKDYKEYSRTSPDVREYDDGAERYALMPASTSYSICHTGIYLGCYFETPKETMFSSIPSKKLTDKDREEIIAILESFRDTP